MAENRGRVLLRKRRRGRMTGRSNANTSAIVSTI